MSLLLDRPDLDTHRPSGGPPPRRRGPRRVALLAAVAVAGGAGGAGAVAATGALSTGASGTTTVVPRVAATTGADTAAPAGLDAAALYDRTAAGVVDITVGEAGGPGASATGTGFIAASDGRIVTAAHVVDDASSITVKLQDGTTRSAKLLGKDDATDIAVLQIDPSGLTLSPLTLGSSKALRIGAPVAAIGDPFTYERSISTGIVSGLDRTVQAPNGFTVAHAVQTDAAVNPGNSGGPLLDAQGTVIGVVDQIATDGRSEQSSGVGFAIPIDLVKSELADLSAGRTVRHAYLGVSTAQATGSTTGALVAAVPAGGPAADAGLRSGDVVTRFDGQAIKGTNDLVAAIAERKPGDRVPLTVRRGSGTETLTVTLGTQPTQRTSN